MSQLNLYIHYDSVTNHMMTRGIDLRVDDFPPSYFPKNLILAEAPKDFGRFDPQTNFKILRGSEEVRDYMMTTDKQKVRMSNWIDFESIESMHLLTPNEISELLYLFHANRSMKSAFFYKLQNNYVYLTLPNGLNKMFYRHVQHFLPRFQRGLTQTMEQLIRENNRIWFARRKVVLPLLDGEIAEKMVDFFADGLKVNFKQYHQEGSRWFIPLDIIEDELTLLSRDQLPQDHIGYLIYDSDNGTWQAELTSLGNGGHE